MANAPGDSDADAPNLVVIGANVVASKETELMEAIPKEKQLTVTFNSISGWVPLMHTADSPLKQLKKLFTAKQEFHGTVKVQRKQVRLTYALLTPGVWNKRCM